MKNHWLNAGDFWKNATTKCKIARQKQVTFRIYCMSLKHESLNKDVSGPGLDATFHNIFESGIKLFSFTTDNKCFVNLDK